MNKYVHTLKYQLRKIDTSCFFFLKSFFLPHAPLSIHAGREVSHRGFLHKYKYREQKFQVGNNKFQRLLAVWWLGIPYHCVHPSSASYIFSFHNCLPREDNTMMALLLLPFTMVVQHYHQFFFPRRWYSILVDTLSFTTSKGLVSKSATL